MIRRRSAIALCALATSLTSSGCFLIYPDLNGDGEVTIDDLDALIAACSTGDGTDGGTDNGPPGDGGTGSDVPPLDGADENPMDGNPGP